VIKIVSITAGFADVDTDGDGNADTGEGITDGERQQLAAQYPAGQTLWRISVTHFSVLDGNWPYGLAGDAKSPSDNGARADKGYDPLQDPTTCHGCVIEMENQVLGESVGIVGTPHTLNYRSDRVPGRAKVLNLTLSGPTVPASLQSIQVHIAIAGQTFDKTFSSAPNQQMTFVWNGLDAYGRSSEGGQLAVGSIDYVYRAVYKGAGAFNDAFAKFGSGAILGNRANSTITISLPFSQLLAKGMPMRARLDSVAGLSAAITSTIPCRECWPQETVTVGAPRIWHGSSSRPCQS
jgi:hypothetical protein